MNLIVFHECLKDNLLWQRELMYDAPSWEHQQDWPYTWEEEGSRGRESSQINADLFSGHSGPGVLDFPVVDGTLVHSDQFLMIPDTHYGFSVQHIIGPCDNPDLSSFDQPMSF